MNQNLKNMSKSSIVLIIVVIALLVWGIKKYAIPKTYTNMKSGYSLTVKPGWDLTALPMSSSDLSSAQVIYIQKAHKEASPSTLNKSVAIITISNLDNPENIDLRALYSKQNSEGDQNLARIGALNKTFEETTFLDRKALKVVTPGLQNVEYLVNKNAGIFLDISLEILGNESDSYLFAEAQFILESIKFN